MLSLRKVLIAFFNLHLKWIRQLFLNFLRYYRGKSAKVGLIRDFRELEGWKALTLRESARWGIIAIEHITVLILLEALHNLIFGDLIESHKSNFCFVLALLTFLILRIDGPDRCLFRRGEISMMGFEDFGWVSKTHIRKGIPNAHIQVSLGNISWGIQVFDRFYCRDRGGDNK